MDWIQMETLELFLERLGRLNYSGLNKHNPCYLQFKVTVLSALSS